MLCQSNLLRSAAIAALFLPALIPGVSAHGSISEFVANGKSYDGPLPAGPTIASPVRQIDNLEPIKDTTSPDMNCGRGASPSASEIAEVTAGSAVSFAWRSGNPGTPWPHTFGPVMQYMAACPGNASSCDATGLKFMKTDEKGLKPDGSGTWFQADINAGKPFTTTIPAGIPDGDYLLRHEIIALHNAMPGGAGAEFYVSCTQVRVTGGGNLRVAPSDLVSFPGAYKANDPGILIDIFEGLKSYPFPGPALIAGSGSAQTSSAQPSKSTSSPSASRPTSKAHSGKCNLARHRRIRRQVQANVIAMSSA